MKRFRYISKLLESKNITPTVKHFVFSAPEDFAYNPGMFMSISFIGPDGKPVGRSYSLASVPSLKNKLEFCIKLVENGKGSNHLFQMQANDELKMMGPMGTYYVKEEHLNQHIVFVATGTGIAPFRSMIKDLLARNDFLGNITLIAGVRSEAEILYENEFLDLEKNHHRFSYYSTVSQPSKAYTGNIGRVQKVLETQIPNLPKNTVFYMCGLKAMLQDVKSLLDRNSIKDKQIFVEQYD